MLKQLEDDDSIAVRYKNNPNGSLSKIAGITNKHKSILGLMPHPERAIEGSKKNDGLKFFKSIYRML